MLLLSPLISSHLVLNFVHTRLIEAPVILPPDGYALRNYLPGDRKTWLGLQRVADPGLELDEDTFVAEFGLHQPSLLSRQFYMVSQGGKPVGTSTAWFGDKASGLVKWLAVTMAHSGRGLEEALLSESLRRFRGFGYQQAEAQISSNRIDLIRLFLNFGFLPQIHSPQEEAVWRDVRMVLDDLTRVPIWVKLAAWFRKLASK